MRRLLLAVGVVILGFAAPRATAFPSIIGIYFSDQGYVCDATIEPLTLFFLYVIAHTGADLPQGLTGAEFRVDNFDLTWIASVTPNPLNAISLGNPIQGGCNIAFSSCQPEDMFGGVLLYTIQVLAPQPIPPRVLMVREHSVPSNPNFVCPLLVNCSAPVFSKYCVSGTTACINRTQTCCISSTEGSSWGQVKSLYGSARP